ncbi:MAG: cytochrome b-245 heavy chain subunit beta, partial [Olpidium bornovanus]
NRSAWVVWKRGGAGRGGRAAGRGWPGGAGARDEQKKKNQAVGWSTFVFTWGHTISHWRNCYSLSRLDGGESWAFYALGTGPGWTGHIMLVTLCLICATSLNKVRRASFEAFWYTHHLYGFYFLLFAVHGSFCFIKTENPPYCVSTGNFWKFWIAGGLCYMLERIAREVRGRRRTYISKVVLHPSKVVELQIKMENTTAQAGQYIFLCCPAVSVLQYHPFTLTSSPEEDFLSVHIKCEGNFTSRLYQVLGCDVQAKGGDLGGRESGSGLPRVMVDGPFGTASQDVFHFEATMLVGAGIGVTPFASILKSIWYRMSQPAEAFEWFQELLKAIEQQDSNGFIDIRVYLTKALKPDEINNVQLNNDRGGRDGKDGGCGLGRNFLQVLHRTRRQETVVVRITVY